MHWMWCCSERRGGGGSDASGERLGAEGGVERVEDKADAAAAFPATASAPASDPEVCDRHCCWCETVCGDDGIGGGGDAGGSCDCGGGADCGVECVECLAAARTSRSVTKGAIPSRHVEV